MKKWFLFCLLGFFVSPFCFASTEMPDELFVTEHWISLTKSYDVGTNQYKLGTVYRRFFSLTTTYDFYNPRDEHTASAKTRFFSFGTDVDIYDVQDRYLGFVEEKIFNFFPTFLIYAADNSTKLAFAKMNFWGTKYYIYDPVTQKEMAVMSRSFFRLKNNWTIRVTNPALLSSKQIDSRVLITVLAIQGEIDDWKHQNSYAMKQDSLPKDIETQAKVAQKMAEIHALYPMLSKHAFDESNLEDLANTLDEEFTSYNNNGLNLDDAETVTRFIDFCIQKMQNLSEPEKAAVMHLLNLRVPLHA